MPQNELSQESIKALNKVPALIKKVFPIPNRFKKDLPSDIAILSGLLTNIRGERSLSYLTRPNFLNAYLYYFMPWNICRLCLLLPDLNINLSSVAIITDLGCGPLTFASALWISCPQLRNINLEINCIDRSAPALEAGKKFFNSLCEAENSASKWKINLIKKDIDFRKTKIIPQTAELKNKIVKEKKASLLCAINVFNEIYENISHNNTEGLRRFAANTALLMHNEASEDASILTVEPGVPQSGRFISLLRDSFLELNRPPVSPCTHISSCPLSPLPNTQERKIKSDNKKKWCHFAQKTACFPKELHELSAAAGLPKERLVLSFLYTGTAQNCKFSQKKEIKTIETAKIISDVFALPDNLLGCYGCSEKGLILLRFEKKYAENYSSGSVVTPIFDKNGQRDKKSGALIAYNASEQKEIK